MSNTIRNHADPLIRRLDEAIARFEGAALCDSIKTILIEELSRTDGVVDDSLLAGSADSYARRLLHRDPQGRYSVVVMVWGCGQETPLHDHGGLWCVECVYRGEIRVTSYERIDADDGYVRFEPAREIYAGVGQAGALIPPVDYHVIDNPHEEVAVTVHVYGGDLITCNVFDPVDPAEDVVQGLYRPRRCELEFSRD